MLIVVTISLDSLLPRLPSYLQQMVVPKWVSIMVCMCACVYSTTPLTVAELASHQPLQASKEEEIQQLGNNFPQQYQGVCYLSRKPLTVLIHCTVFICYCDFHTHRSLPVIRSWSIFLEAVRSILPWVWTSLAVTGIRPTPPLCTSLTPLVPTSILKHSSLSAPSVRIMTRKVFLSLFFITFKSVFNCFDL